MHSDCKTCGLLIILNRKWQKGLPGSMFGLWGIRIKKARATIRYLGGGELEYFCLAIFFISQGRWKLYFFFISGYAIFLHALWPFIYFTHFSHKNIYFQKTLQPPPPPSILMVAPLVVKAKCGWDVEAEWGCFCRVWTLDPSQTLWIRSVFRDSAIVWCADR